MLTVDTILQKRYRIIRQLGQGGMGAVYLAVDERLDKTVAIKEILLELEHTSDKKQQELIKQAFKREANSLVKARHEAVPDVTDYFSDFDREFLVMEFIEGDDLMKLLQKRGAPFSIEEVSPWIDQLLVALDYLHNLSPPIIHRDIKPQNLKVNQWKKIKLLDFGVAKNTDKAATITQMTFIGATLSYSPIEQILRVIDPMFRELILLQHKEKAEKVLSQNTDSRCDIFAIGATFYHLLTNRAPVEVTKRALEFWEGKGDPLKNPSELNSDISESISSWLLKAMAISREDRFASAVKMRKAFKEALSAKTAEKPTEKVTEVLKAADLQEQVLMQADTALLIEPPPKSNTEKEISQKTLPPTADAVEESKSDTFSSHEAESTDFKFTDTDISNFKTSDDLTHLNIDDSSVKTQEIFAEENNSANFVSIPNSQTVSKPFNYLLLLPIIGIFGFVVIGGGIFGMMMMSGSETPVKNNSVIENSNSAKTPETAATVSTDLNISETNSSTETIPAATKSPEKTVSETQPITETKTPNISKTPVQPVRTPVVTKEPAKPAATPIVKPQPQATPKKKKLTDDCIYNARCE